MNVRLVMILSVVLLVVSLAGGLQYYRAQSLAHEVKITTLKADINTLKSANAGLQKQAAKVKADVERYVAAMNKMGEANTALNAKLQSTRAKLARHKLLKIRNGRHSELLLKAINRSTEKMQQEWMK